MLTEGYNYAGVKADIKVWNPHVESDDEFSTSRISLRSGPWYDFESVEAGWAVSISNSFLIPLSSFFFFYISCSFYGLHSRYVSLSSNNIVPEIWIRVLPVRMQCTLPSHMLVKLIVDIVLKFSNFFRWILVCMEIDKLDYLLTGL